MRLGTRLWPARTPVPTETFRESVNASFGSWQVTQAIERSRDRRVLVNSFRPSSIFSFVRGLVSGTGKNASRPAGTDRSWAAAVLAMSNRRITYRMSWPHDSHHTDFRLRIASRQSDPFSVGMQAEARLAIAGRLQLLRRASLERNSPQIRAIARHQ